MYYMHQSFSKTAYIAKNVNVFLLEFLENLNLRTSETRFCIRIIVISSTTRSKLLIIKCLIFKDLFINNLLIFLNKI